MPRVLGVDGCRGGWLGALVEGDAVTWLRFGRIDEALAVEVAAIGVDMPIGLPSRGRRECDLAAKRLLGRAHPRVFLTPPRGVLDASTYAGASHLHRRLTGGLGMSVQTWHLLPKIREVDAVAGTGNLLEVHPEVSFARMAGRPLPSKRTAAGRAERLTVLKRWLPGLGAVPAGDDAPDALAVAWSAARWARGEAESLPDPAPVDEHGLPMRMVV